MAGRTEFENLIKAVDGALSELTLFRLRHENLDLTNLLPLRFDEIETDSFGQLIDKLLVVHIRYWKLEDEMSAALDDQTLAQKRRVSEPLLKVHRPMLVRALDKRNVNTLRALTEDKPDIEQLPKSYRGWQSRDV